MFEPLVPILIFLITAGAKEFSERVLGRPLDANASVIIASLVAALIMFANSIAPLFPSNVLPVIAQIVTLIVAIASAFGIHATIKMFVKQ